MNEDLGFSGSQIPSRNFFGQREVRLDPDPLRDLDLYERGMAFPRGTNLRLYGNRDDDFACEPWKDGQCLDL